MSSTAKDLFVIGLDPFNREKLATIRNPERYNFHGVLDPAEVFDTYDFPIADMLQRAETQIRQWQEESRRDVDGIVGYMDFPVSTMLPLLCERFDVVSPSLESLLACEHKYWSRLAQSEIIGDHIPQFRAFDPFDDDAFAKIDLELPFWIKPIKSSGSMLGFRILTREDFDTAIAQIREEIHLISEPFDFVLDQAELPAEVTEVGGHYCLAESIIGGRQCTVEGYSWNGEVETFGIIDSIRYRNGSSFFRYEYPSTLPDVVREKMVELTGSVISHIGFDNSAFNIEYFWDRARNHVWLLEINTRVSMSHSDVFEKVDGQTNQQVPVQVACGEKPEFPKGEGRYNSAAKFFWRTFDGDAIVTTVPTEDEIIAVKERFPGTVVRPQVKVGMKLSDLLEQDSYSYAICQIYIGGDDTKDLLDKFVTCQEMLSFEFEPIAA